MKKLLAVLLAVMLAVGGSALALADGELGIVPCRVTMDKVNERIGPARTFDIARRHNTDEIVYVVDMTGDWWQLANGNYIKSDYLEKVGYDDPNVSSIPCRVTAKNVNERVGPSKAYKSVGWHQKDEVVYVINTTGTWWQLANGNYMSSKYLEKLTDGEPTVNPGDLAEPVPCVVIANRVNERLGPSKSFKSVRKHPEGDIVYVINMEGEWWKLSNGHYMMAEFLGFIPEDEAAAVVVTPCMVTANRVNERLGPSKGFRSVRQHPMYSVVNVIDMTGEWWKLENGHYMMAEFLKPIE